MSAVAHFTPKPSDEDSVRYLTTGRPCVVVTLTGHHELNTAGDIQVAQSTKDTRQRTYLDREYAEWLARSILAVIESEGAVEAGRQVA